MIRFLQPEWLWLLTLLPLALLWRGRRGAVAAVQYSNVSLARQVSERDPQNDQRTHALRDLEATLDESRLAKEDVFYRPSRTEGEREWLLQNRPEEARHWNLLTDLRPAHLQYGN